ncbi:MAG TPA: molecular chaperone DnaK [Nitrospiria bacterium]
MGRIVGIDLGTTNSLVAHMDGKTPKVIRGPEGKALLPSVVSVVGDGWVVGDPARARLSTHPEMTIYSVKRLMGRSLADVEGERSYFPFELSEEQPGVVRVELGGRSLTPPEVSALILREIRARAEQALGETVTQAVVTVPAYFNDSQRQATKDAGRIAGLEVLRIVNEPTAACLAYGLQKRKEGVIAVYDLGGGTFDISILKVKNGIFEVLSTNGNTRLGGDDIDRRLLDMLAQEIVAGDGPDPRQQKDLLQVLRLKAEGAKRALSEKEVVDLSVPIGGGRVFTRSIKRSELEALAGGLVEQTLAPCRQALADAGLSAEAVDEVVLVGGSTRMPLIHHTIGKFFGKTPHSEINPDEVVALGAAVQADILAGGIQNMLLLDVTPLSLGIETMGGVMSVLIARNSTIPTNAEELFTTYVDGQSAVDIHVLQGERELVKDNRSLCRFQLKGIDPMPAGLPRIEVNFTIDANGILHVSAKDLRSGKAQAMEVKPSYGLSDDEVQRMIEDSYTFARSDIEERMVIEARNEAEIILHHTERALEQSRGQIEPEEAGRIEAVLAALKEAMKGSDHKAIRGRLEELDRLTQPLAERLMNATLSEELKDKKLSELP